MPLFYAYPQPTFQPAMRLVSNVTNANPGVVTTTFAHNYITGTIVRMLIPQQFGMSQLNTLTPTITVLSPTTFSMNIDTSLFYPFLVPNPLPNNVTCMCIPIGEIPQILTAAVQNVLPYSAT